MFQRLRHRIVDLLPDFSPIRRRDSGSKGSVGRIIGWGIGIILLLALLYYPLGMAWVHRIDDNLEQQITPPDLVAGGSRSVAMAAALIERETSTHRWVANDPFFLPGAALDNMPAFQQGIISAIGRYAFVLVDQIGRTRGSSETDKDLQEASGQLQYAGDVWIFDLSTSLAPTTTSEARYLKARKSLVSYNSRLAAGEAIFERRADNLMAALDRIALDIGASSAVLERHIDEYAGAFIDTAADDLFYGVKGQVYAYYLLLREIKTDFGNLLRERELVPLYDQLLQSLAAAAALQPWIVANGAPDGQIMPSHLASQGFYLLRARAKLREITNILLK